MHVQPPPHLPDNVGELSADYGRSVFRAAYENMAEGLRMDMCSKGGTILKLDVGHKNARRVRGPGGQPFMEGMMTIMNERHEVQYPSLHTPIRRTHHTPPAAIGFLLSKPASAPTARLWFCRSLAAGLALAWRRWRPRSPGYTRD